EKLNAAASELFDLVLKKKIMVRIDQRYPLEEAGQAQTALAARKTSGARVLTLDRGGAGRPGRPPRATVRPRACAAGRRCAPGSAGARPRWPPARPCRRCRRPRTTWAARPPRCRPGAPARASWVRATPSVGPSRRRRGIRADARTRPR